MALGRAFAEIWDVPRVEQPSGLKARARGLLLLAILGVTLVGATVATGVAAGGDLGPGVQEVAAMALSLMAGLRPAIVRRRLLTAVQAPTALERS